jgi:hypothetical protein
MKLNERLSNKQRKKFRAHMRDSKPPSSMREWEELMGTNRDTYKRHKGAIRRKLRC